jgi:hypothetical protein
VGDIVVGRANRHDGHRRDRAGSGSRHHGLSLETIAPITKTRDAAVRGYENASGQQRVWLFDGIDAADKNYSEARAYRTALRTALCQRPHVQTPKENRQSSTGVPRRRYRRRNRCANGHMTWLAAYRRTRKQCQMLPPIG